MLKECRSCHENFDSKKKDLVINNIPYQEVICDDCVKQKSIQLNYKPKSNLRAKIRYDIPDNIWDNRLKGRYTTEWWIKKYGEEAGLKKQQEWKNKTSGSIQRYINKYGIEEGTQKYNDFKNNCSIFNTNRIEKYGNEHFLKTIENYNNRKFNTRLDYYLEKTNGDYEQAAKLLSERQSTSTLQKFIKRYGEEGGQKKYQQTNRKKLFFNKGSKIENEFFILFIDELKKQKINYIDITQQRHFFLGDISTKFRNVLVDIYIPEYKLIIEFFGDFWHCNPKIFLENDFNIVLKMFAKEKWEYDSEKIKLLYQKYNVKTKIVWESDFRKNKKLLVKKIIEDIYGKN